MPGASRPVFPLFLFAVFTTYFKIALTMLIFIALCKNSRIMTNFSNIRQLYAIYDQENAGFTETDISALESKLECRLPAVLRAYFLTLGKHENLNFSYNRLLKPDKEIGFSDDRYLVFYEENQVVVYWGIKEKDLGLDNPPVYGNYFPAGEKPDWQLQANTTSDFLLLMAVYNGTLGGLPYNANSFNPIKKETIGYIKENWSAVKELSFGRQEIYTDRFHDVISISFDEEQNGTGIFIGTSNQARFDKMLDNIDVDWSYTSYEDEDAEEEDE